MKIIKIISALTFSLLFTGCVTTTALNNIPVKDSDFRHSLSYLKTHYTDINEYNGSKEFEFFKRPKFPKIEQLKQTWGEPNTIKPNWAGEGAGLALNVSLLAADIFTLGTFGIVTALSLPLDEIYEWEKENIHIKVLASQNSFSGYEPIVIFWKWSEIDNKLQKSVMK